MRKNTIGNSIDIENKTIDILAIGYLYLPLLIFLTGWLKACIGIPVALLCLFGIYLHTKTMTGGKITVKRFELPAVFAVIVLFLILLGHNGLFFQNFDWYKHHAVLFDLMHLKWPVIYDNDSMLTYYLGQYMVPSLIGKITGSAFILRQSVLIWNSLGLVIVYLLLSKFLDVNSAREKALTIAVMLLGAGLPYFGSIAYRAIDSGLTEAIINTPPGNITST